MRTINLLPWREELRAQAQRNFLGTLALAVIIAAAVVFAVNRYFEARISEQQSRNSYLQAEIAKLDRQIARIEELDQTRESLLNRKQVIENLQANRTLMVRLFDEMVRTVPSGVRLTQVTQAGERITISGLTQSNARVSTYLNNVEAAGVLHDPQLQIIELQPEPADPQLPFEFTFTARVAAPEVDETDPSAADAQEVAP